MPQQDTVTINWSGASCQILNGGKQALCQIGTAGSGSIIDIFVDADDAAVLPAGDDGSRDDPAVHVGTSKTGIWVEIGVNSQGPMDSDTPAEVNFEPYADPRTLGGVEVTDYGAGLYLRVELTGTVTPAVPDGTGQFEWRQTLDVRVCYHAPDDTVSGFGQFKGTEIESPATEDQSHVTKNSKGFMIDNPGRLFSSMRPASAYDQSRAYYNFTTWVEFDNGFGEAIASNQYEWHMMTIGSDGTDWQVGLSSMTPAVPGSDNVNPPTGNAPSETGNYPVDCSNQTW